ncbi:hypothetical protein OEZ60_08055 [Defluviimonas sp. WL0024]|uniref:Uncharacterized protein n=1 Tax=Albidovulum salinarum TaxID=2984153 RepID=A0ABT2X200_9RHOB|nr:hypothetical protein [Defluviimonas sp. WL0024]MCU9847958.1 hypothetical protein [Defluviimonas sp. WL0024]
MREALDRLAASASGPLAEPKKSFGPLYSRLAREYLGERAFDALRQILRECILDHWPIAAGEVVLGAEVSERRFHSLRTAAAETGVGAEVLEYFLIEAGAISAQDGRPPARKLFDAQAHASLLAEIPALVGPIAMRDAIGATRQELAALEKDGLLAPRVRASKVKNPWRLSDGLELMSDLEEGARPVSAEDGNWETLLLARNRSGLCLGDLLKAIREGALTKGQQAGAKGFHSIVVRKRDVDALAAVVLSARPDVGRMLPGFVSAASFGRSVGLRDHGDFTALIEAGQTPALRVLHPKTNRPQYRMTQADIEAFHRRFVTMTTLAAQTGMHRNSLGAKLAAARVARFSHDGQEFGPVYLRREAEIALR